MINNDEGPEVGSNRDWTLAELLRLLVCRVESKLRFKKIPDFERATKRRELLGEAIDGQAGLRELTSDMASAEALGPDYFRAGAKGIVRAEFDRRREPVLEKLAELLSGWGMADIIARAVVEEVVGKGWGESRHRKSANSGEPCKRFLIYFALPLGAKPDNAAVEALTEEFTRTYDDFAELEVCGQMVVLSGLDFKLETIHASYDGLYMIVRTEIFDFWNELAYFLGQRGAENLRMIQLVVPEPAADPLETH